MKKKFTTKKRYGLKNIIGYIIICSIIIGFFYISDTISINLPIKLLFKSENKYSYVGTNEENITDEIYNYIRMNLFSSPVNILKNTFHDYRVDEPKTTSVISFNYVKNEYPIIYIYNSHQGETYSSTYLENYNITPNVIMASNMLKDKLDNLNIYTIVENSDILSYMRENNLNHAGSYIASRHFLKKVMDQYPNIKLYIDLHRDSVTHNVSTTSINGKDCARVLFVIGLEYKTYNENLQITTDINNIILKKYPSLTRGIMKKQGYGVNGVYNQDLANNIILIEIGGNENNIEEVNNTLDLIAEVIGEYINEKEL